MLRHAYNHARTQAKSSPHWSHTTFRSQLARDGIDDPTLVQETGDAFDPTINPQVENRLLGLLHMRGPNPRPDHVVLGPGRDVMLKAYQKLYQPSA